MHCKGRDQYRMVHPLTSYPVMGYICCEDLLRGTWLKLAEMNDELNLHALLEKGVRWDEMRKIGEGCLCMCIILC
ncbi:hypothetical protein EYC80_000429 [Monilinia laxa]|uniref:Uncharacterized protein n=1 Tax=Monilinia laxa TaxID=61186 RepID=A0A5N6KAQ6_MONLA|nr:hypothetical protein EYC80_000429 [Monilinia laxa]